MKDIEEILEGSSVAFANAVKRVAEESMYESVGEKSLKEGEISDEAHKEEILEYAQTLDKTAFFEKIKEMGIPRSSRVVRSVEPLLKD